MEILFLSENRLCFSCRRCDALPENVWSKDTKFELLWTYLHTYILQNTYVFGVFVTHKEPPKNCVKPKEKENIPPHILCFA